MKKLPVNHAGSKSSALILRQRIGFFFPAFMSEEHFWRIWCWPYQGDVEGEIDKLEFSLFYGGEWEDVKVNLDFGVLKKNEASSSVKWMTTTHTFPECGKGITLDKIVQGDELRRYLKDDYFIVLCKIKILSTGNFGGGVTILSSLSGISKSGLNDSGGKIKKEMASGLVQFKVVSSYIIANDCNLVKFPMFIVGEHCWFLECSYRNIVLSFNLYVRSETKDIKVGVEFSMLKKDDSTSSVKWRSTTYTFKNCGAVLTMDEFIGGGELLQYLQDDYFRVICNITILSETITSGHDVTIISRTGKPKIYSVNGPSPFLHDDVGKLLQNKERSDVTFEVNGEKFHAHRLLLATRSPVFNAELFGPWNENNKKNIKVNEMEPMVFEAMLHFVYTDMLPNFNEASKDGNKESNQISLIQMFQHLLAAADRYALERLKILCEDKLSNSITINTVATTLILAEKHNCSNLKARCIEFITSPQCLVKVALTDGYFELIMSCPTILKELRTNFNNLSL
ncbi:hypothetical protein LUZ60_010558 [Juncus effusus]|nr:hypothetical protein LUZ60_010558 [Juncus effusus]